MLKEADGRQAGWPLLWHGSWTNGGTADALVSLPNPATQHDGIGAVASATVRRR